MQLLIGKTEMSLADDIYIYQHYLLTFIYLSGRLSVSLYLSIHLPQSHTYIHIYNEMNLTSSIFKKNDMIGAVRPNTRSDQN